MLSYSSLETSLWNKRTFCFINSNSY